MSRLRVWTTEGDVLWVQPDAEPALDAAVSHYVDTGRDALVTMEPLEGNGSSVTVLASVVYGWYRSTEESQRRVIELAVKDEATNNAAHREFSDPDWL